jgi:hypothetical protein
MRLIDKFRSLRLALKASGLLGRANKLRRRNQPVDALEVARSGLALLASPGVCREDPHEGSVLVTLTLLTEDLAGQLRQPGASLRDLRDSLKLLKALPDAKASVRDTKVYWIPYLEARLASGPTA